MNKLEKEIYEGYVLWGGYFKSMYADYIHYNTFLGLTDEESFILSHVDAGMIRYEDLKYEKD